ncbi:hypothetical protein MSZK_00150 [Mycobacterium sp. shizuoka-1]|nr:hypothetical protein MSZK_00150 [Mycobacterium sp. shizuoka-1]
MPEPTRALIAPAPIPANAITIMWETDTTKPYRPATTRRTPGADSPKTLHRNVLPNKYAGRP